MEKLFNAELNEDITDHAVLTKAAVGGGLEEQEVKEWLESDRVVLRLTVELLPLRKVHLW